jgi:HEAT repeat protein
MSADVRRLVADLSSREPATRLRAAQELGRLRASNSVPWLIHATNDIRPDVCVAVVEALAEIAAPASCPALCAQLKGGEWRSRQAAAQGLGRIRDPAAVPCLLEAVRDDHIAVATAAAAALGSCGGIDALRSVACSTNEAVSAREAVLLVIGEFGSSGIDALAVAARDTNAAVRVAAYGALAKVGRAKEAPLLVDGLLDSSPVVRKACEKAVFAMEPEAVLPTLVAAMENGGAERQMAILKMLESDRTARGLGVLAVALVSERESVRSSAGNILSNRRQQLLMARRDPRMLPVDPFLRALSGSNAAVRAAAMTHIERDAVVNRSIEPRLREALKDPNAAVRVVVVRLLATLAPERIEEALVPVLADTDTGVRLAAALRLAPRTNELAVGIVVEALAQTLRAYNEVATGKSRQDFGDRMGTLIRAAGSSRSRKAVPALVECLDIPDDELTAEAIRALGAIGDRSVYDKVAPFLQRMKWVEHGVRNAAIEAMASLDPARAAADLLPLLADTAKWQAESCIVTLCRVLARIKDPRAAEHMINRLHEQYEKESGRMNEVKLAAVAGLVELGGAAVPAIVRRLSDPKVREGSLAMILGRIGEPAVKPAIEALKSADPVVRKNAAWALGYLSARPDATGGLLAALGDGEVEVRAAAAWAIGRIQAREAVSVLRGLLDSEHAKERLAAAEALGRIGDASAASALVARVRDPAPDVRLAVVTALGSVGGRAAIEPLKALIGDEKDERVRFAASEAIAALGGTTEKTDGR